MLSGRDAPVSTCSLPRTAFQRLTKMAPAAVYEVPPESKQIKKNVPTVPVFANDADVEDVVQGLIVAGGCVIRNAVPIEDVKQIEKDSQPWLDADKPWDGDFFPPETRRAYGLPQKSQTFVNSFIKNDIYQKVCDKILTKKSLCWNGQKREESVSKPQLNTTVVFNIGPGARAQELHRDDMLVDF